MSPSTTAIKNYWSSLWNTSFVFSLLALNLTLLGILCLTVGYTQYSFSIILMAMLFDLLSGTGRWKKGEQSQFMTAFNLLQGSLNYVAYPALLFFLDGFHHWAVLPLACIFVTCGLCRLARFGSTELHAAHSGPARMGMPVYYNHVGGLLLLLVHQSEATPYVAAGWLLVGSAFMVSTLPFPRPKNTTALGVGLIIASVFFLWR